MFYDLPVLRDIKAFLDIVDWVKANTGIREFYQQRKTLDSAWWTKFYTDRPRPESISIMGQSLAKLFSQEPQASLFRDWCEAGTNMRILVLSPDAPEVSQVQSVSKGILYQEIEDPREVMRRKIFDTADLFRSKVASKIKDADKKPSLRFATRDMPFSVVAIGPRKLHKKDISSML